MENVARKKVVAFLILTFAFSAPFYFLIIRAGSVNIAGGLYVAAIMWCPGAAALLTRLFFQRNLHGFGWSLGRTRYQAASYVVPLGACLIVYGFVWVAGLGDVSVQQLTSAPADMFGLVQPSSFPLAVTLAGTVGVLEMVIFATGEEWGWRGLLVPELAQLTGYTGAASISGLCGAYSTFRFCCSPTTPALRRSGSPLCSSPQGSLADHLLSVGFD